MYKNKTEAADALFRELDNKVCDLILYRNTTMQ